MSNAINGFRSYLDAFTAVTTQQVGSATSTTDVVLYDNDYTDFCGITWDGGLNVLGLSQCVSINAAYECEKDEVRFDSGDYPSFNYTDYDRLACHEVGHAMILDHKGGVFGSRGDSDWANSCMQQGLGNPTGFTQHDKDHLANDII